MGTYGGSANYKTIEQILDKKHASVVGKLDSSMIMKGEKLTNQAFHPCFIYNSYIENS